MSLMLTPIGFTLTAQSLTRWVVSLMAWMPLSVNCTKLMYVGMIVTPLDNDRVGLRGKTRQSEATASVIERQTGRE